MGHVLRQILERLTFGLTHWKPTETERREGRLQKPWLDDVKRQTLVSTSSRRECIERRDGDLRCKPRPVEEEAYSGNTFNFESLRFYSEEKNPTRP